MIRITKVVLSVGGESFSSFPKLYALVSRSLRPDARSIEVETDIDDIGLAAATTDAIRTAKTANRSVQPNCELPITPCRDRISAIAHAIAAGTSAMVAVSKAACSRSRCFARAT